MLDKANILNYGGINNVSICKEMLEKAKAGHYARSF